MKKQDKWYIWVEGKKIEVSEEVYRAYWHYTEKERYFTKTLKQGKFVCSQEDEPAQFTPSREDSLERLEMLGVEFPDTTSQSPDDVMAEKELLSNLEQALSVLTCEEMALIQELFYLEKTEREVSKAFHCAKTTLRRRKEKILAKLRKEIEKK